jgi:hypothetical protein
MPTGATDAPVNSDNIDSLAASPALTAEWAID